MFVYNHFGKTKKWVWIWLVTNILILVFSQKINKHSDLGAKIFIPLFNN